MTTVDLPPPVVRPRAGAGVDTKRLRADLEARVDGEIRFDAGSRSAYSTDASNYRQVPIGVVVPRTVEAGAEAVAVCRDHSAPLLSRGGGTSLAGECTNTAVVIDWSKYCTGLVSVDPERATCVVEPGIVLDHLNDLLKPHQLEFGPEPATHNHCTIGGMIGNNSCGATAQRTGKVVDNVVRLEVLLYDGTRMWVGATPQQDWDRIQDEGGRQAELYRQMHTLRERYAEQVRATYPDIPRRVSGYNLDSLLPEKEFNVAQALVGSEGTLVTVLRAELALVPVVPERVLVVLAFPDVAAAADAVPGLLPAEPIALEGLDRQLVDFEREKNLNPVAMDFFPEGHAFLLVQFGGDTAQEARGRAEHMLDTIGKSREDDDVQVFDDEEHQKEIWQVREAGLGATARVPGLPDTWPGWEDSAVDPDRLGDYLRGLRALYEKYGFTTASLYGHFGQGCVHTRIPFDLRTPAGVQAFRSFMEEATDLAVSHGGSLSGEHGDGQARGELLPKMFGEAVVTAFGQLKAVFDPADLMNPGKVVAPYPLDDKLRLGTDYSHPTMDTHFKYPHDEGSFGRAVLRCVGVGKCRREGGGVMCPSYQVTREEEHSTRGRARLLFEMLDGGARGGAITDGWRSEAVKDALDLCLACKGCKTDCPVNVDMATYKAEFLSHHYQGRLRPLAHYSMGWLPVWAKVASYAPRVVNALSQAPGIAQVMLRAAGADQRRDVPLFAQETLQEWFARRGPVRGAGAGRDAGRGVGHRGEVLLWPDSFTNSFHPHIGKAAVEVLEHAGWRVVMPEQSVCCGLTWISTGQLDTAKRVIGRTMDVLRPHVRAGTLVLGLEPSCTAVFRSDAPELFPHDDDIARLRDQTVTLAELLMDHTEGWEPPRLAREAVVQTHCHQHAVMGFEQDQRLMESIGLDARVLDSGCCGLAGNFGFEKGHYDVSMACAERVLLPELRDVAEETIVLADGFSCRTQIEQGDSGGRAAVHLAEVLQAALRGDPAAGRERPEEVYAERPRRLPARAEAAVSAVVGVTAVAGLALAAKGLGHLVRRLTRS